ncbi:PspC domain-containing protein [Luedemannella helvata]|uniref:ATP-binding protein n=1 Tax=Luedemannella helvata TaxID=349315 RepID=A0ABN2JQC1_9ACTN
MDGPAATAYQPRRLYRDRGDRLVAGVAAGLAEHLRLPVAAVRIGFVALVIANGLGILLYVAFWAVLPVSPKALGAPPRKRRPLELLPFLGLIVGVFLLQLRLGWFGLNATVVALLALVALGAGIIWHQADPARRKGMADPAETDLPWSQRFMRGFEEESDRDRRWSLLRIIGGGLLVITGIIAILTVYAAPYGSIDLSSIGLSLAFAVLALAGVVLILAPLIYRIFGQLREERVARIREQERAEIAAVVHDQVLHTLALIQRSATDSASVQRLARGQERSLRNWLYKPAASPAERVTAALEEVAAEVEDSYGIAVETVIVGDAPSDDDTAALVAAVREALVNAARHAKVPSVSLYAEMEEDQISAYVRDRGAGFELSSVDGDRQGVKGSIIGRMDRHGGTAEIRTAPGEGTEVALHLPRGRERKAGS